MRIDSSKKLTKEQPTGTRTTTTILGGTGGREDGDENDDDDDDEATFASSRSDIERAIQKHRFTPDEPTFVRKVRDHFYVEREHSVARKDGSERRLSERVQKKRTADSALLGSFWRFTNARRRTSRCGLKANI